MMALCRSQPPPVELSLHPSMNPKLIHGAFRAPLHPCRSSHKRGLGIPHQTDSCLYLAFSSGFHTQCRTHGFCLCDTLQGTSALHIGVSNSLRLPTSFGLQSSRQNTAKLCLFVCKSMPFYSNSCTGFGPQKVSMVLFKNSVRFSSSFAPKVWRKDRNAQSPAFIEQSNSANEEILLFFFQLDLTTGLQRALNLDQYEAAQQLREKIVEVDKEVERLREAKLGSVSSKSEAQDKAIAILRLKNELQQAVEAEDYNGAAELRDQISKLEAESLAAAARALVFQNVEYSFRLGQKILHSKFGYRGVVCGMDPIWSESESWSASAGVQDLPRGRNQPFYQVLVDMRAEPDLLVAYVAEDNLVPPKEPDKDTFDHPYISFLFFGMDSAGDFIPIKQLREKFSQPRHELPWEGGNGGVSDDGGNAKP